MIKIWAIVGIPTWKDSQDTAFQTFIRFWNESDFWF